MEDKITREAGLRYWEVQIKNTRQVLVVVFTGDKYYRTQLAHFDRGYILSFSKSLLAEWKTTSALIVREVTSKYLKLQGLPLYEVSF